MRQKYVTPATVLVVAVVLVVIAAFASIRDGSNADSHEHEHDDMQSHDSSHHDDDKSLSDEPSGVIKDGERVIEVRARQFEFDPNSIVVRKGETVRLEITSEDVTHGFNLEGHDIDRELKPNQTETITFVPEKSGRFQFRCSVYCGRGHTDMNGELIVIEQDG